MKNKLVITFAFGLFLISCQNSGEQQDTRNSAGQQVSGTSVKKSSAQLSSSSILCILYSIFNQHGPTGPTVLYSYLDCNGAMQTGSVDPRQTVHVWAQQGTVKCPGGVVKENKVSKKTDPSQSKGSIHLSQKDRSVSIKAMA